MPAASYCLCVVSNKVAYCLRELWLSCSCCWAQVVTTISQGKIVWDNDKLSVEPGSGRFIRRQPFAPHIYTGIKEQEAQWIAEEFPYGATPVKRKGDKAAGRDEL